MKNNALSFIINRLGNSLATRIKSLKAVLAYCLLLLIVSCETPEKVLKSTDLEYKKAKAISWYNKKEYVKCIPVMEELISLMKMRESVEELYFMYCMANYHQGDYMIAAYHFKYFYDQYPYGVHAEEALYMQGKSFQELSPKYELDQTYTYKAIDAFQYFLNMYSDGKYINESNASIELLRKKLEKKALSAADLYYRTGNFKAAAVSYANLLIDYPDIDNSEKISFMSVKAGYKYAENSIPQRKAERYNQVINSYADFKYKYDSSRYIPEASKYEFQAHYLAVKGAYEWAETAPLEDREQAYYVAFNEAKRQAAFITSEKQVAELAKWKEKGYFMIVKNNYLLSEILKEKRKVVALEKTVKTYATFASLFPTSKYASAAEKIVNNSNDQLKKLKGNG